MDFESGHINSAELVSEEWLPIAIVVHDLAGRNYWAICLLVGADPSTLDSECCKASGSLNLSLSLECELLLWASFGCACLRDIGELKTNIAASVGLSLVNEVDDEVSRLKLVERSLWSLEFTACKSCIRSELK
jgi:hypothetical protein